MTRFDRAVGRMPSEYLNLVLLQYGSALFNVGKSTMSIANFSAIAEKRIGYYPNKCAPTPLLMHFERKEFYILLSFVFIRPMHKLLGINGNYSVRSIFYIKESVARSPQGFNVRCVPKMRSPASFVNSYRYPSTIWP